MVTVAIFSLAWARAVALHSYGSPPGTQFWELHNVAVKQRCRHTSWPMAAKARAPSSSEHLSRCISTGIFLSWAAQPSPLALLLPTVASGHCHPAPALGFWPPLATFHPALMAAPACCSQALSWSAGGPSAWNGNPPPTHTHTHTPLPAGLNSEVFCSPEWGAPFSTESPPYTDLCEFRGKNQADWGIYKMISVLEELKV